MYDSCSWCCQAGCDAPASSAAVECAVSSVIAQDAAVLAGDKEAKEPQVSRTREVDKTVSGDSRMR